MVERTGSEQPAAHHGRSTHTARDGSSRRIRALSGGSRGPGREARQCRLRLPRAASTNAQENR
jgi:hypothetical protein